MKKRYLFSLITLLLLVACQPESSRDSKKSDSQTTIPSKKMTTDNQALKVVEHFKIKNENCQLISQERYCDSIEIEADTFDNPALNNYIYQTITGSEQPLNGDLKTVLNDLSKQELQRLGQRYHEENSQEYPYAETRYDNLRLITSTPQFAFFKHDYVEYTGGAHPNTYIYNLVIDTNTHQNIVLDKMLLPKAREKLLKLQRDAVLQALIQRNLENEYVEEKPSVDELKKMIEEWDIKLNTNWGFNKNSLLFTYSPYEAAPYMYGVIDIAIPKEELTEIIQPKYLQLIF